MQDAVRSALASAPSEQAPPFELVTFRGSGPKAGIDLDPSAELLAAEDVERHGHR